MVSDPDKFDILVDCEAEHRITKNDQLDLGKLVKMLSARTNWDKGLNGLVEVDLSDPSLRQQSTPRMLSYQSSRWTTSEETRKRIHWDVLKS
jgi:hypothetical protein